MSGQTPREHRFAGPRGEMCWFEWGEPGNGPGVFLLHATGFHARCWDRVIAALPDGTHVVALDMPGHGRSFRPPTLAHWADTAADVTAFARAALPDGSVGVGHSMGGYMLLRALAALPGRFARALLVDPVVFAPETYAAARGAEPGDPARHPVAFRRNRWDSAAQMREHFRTRPPFNRWDEAVLADYCEHALVPAATGEGLELACPAKLEASAYLGVAGSDPLVLLERITCPVRVLRALHVEQGSPLDFSGSPTWPGLAGALPQGEDMHWPDTNHFIPMEHPDRIAALIARALVMPQRAITAG